MGLTYPPNIKLTSTEAVIKVAPVKNQVFPVLVPSSAKPLVEKGGSSFGLRPFLYRNQKVATLSPNIPSLLHGRLQKTSKVPVLRNSTIRHIKKVFFPPATPLHDLSQKKPSLPAYHQQPVMQPPPVAAASVESIPPSPENPFDISDLLVLNNDDPPSPPERPIESPQQNECDDFLKMDYNYDPDQLKATMSWLQDLLNEDIPKVQHKSEMSEDRIKKEDGAIGTSQDPFEETFKKLIENNSTLFQNNDDFTHFN